MHKSVLLVCFLFLFAATSASAQTADPLQTFAAESAIAEDVRVDAIMAYLLKRIPVLAPPSSVTEWEATAGALRSRYRDDLVLRGVPDTWRSHEVRIEWTEDIDTPHGYRIRKFRYEALPSLWIPALLYEPDVIEGKVPAILNVNGHVGPPGKASDYEQIRCINLAKRGMLALHPEWFACGELVSSDYTHSKLAYLDLVGVSGLSLFHYALERALDVLLDDPRTDPNRVAMTGLSGGGWQTTVFSAIDERVRVIVPNAGHSGVSIRLQDLRNMGDLEQVPVDLLTIADFSHITALFAPRPVLLIYNAQDHCCFTAAEALPTVYDPVVPVYRAYGNENDFTFHINEDPGTHNYELDNRLQFYKFINRYFLPEGERFEDEIPSDDEVLSVEALEVGLPADNATFKSLALAIAENISRPEFSSADEVVAALTQVTRYKPIECTAEVVDETDADGIHATAFTFGSEYGPFYGLLLETPSANGTALVRVADKPISTSLPQLRALAETYGRVLAIAPIFVGGDLWHYGMALQASGERILGVQAAQINAVCNWLRDEQGIKNPRIHAQGPVSGTAILIAAALADSPVADVTLLEGPTSFLDPSIGDIDWARHQALYCFGLQAALDFDDVLQLLNDTGTTVTRDAR